ncbi:hypothetical protein ID866_1999 [Astraeus odoratus]|nr:hypothetical protein ID866_1999 [Astraeus odoratus]
MPNIDLYCLESDYTIFVWRQKSASSCILHVSDPSLQLPGPSEYRNPSFYLFRPGSAVLTLPVSESSSNTRNAKGKHCSNFEMEDSGAAKHRTAFQKFHNENGVRTVVGSIGPVDNVRMLLRKGYRHVYMSRKFALRHGFIPADAAPGHYGYGGLVNLGRWPITLKVTSPSGPPTTQRPSSDDLLSRPKSKTVSVPVYLSEEPHFDVVLGRSFFDSRQIKTSAIDPTEVICLDTGEKIECELVVLKDGRGEIVLVT